MVLPRLRGERRERAPAAGVRGSAFGSGAKG
ncbi:hypothetical protein FHS34_007634 [Streptomyces echinatus]|uniref:Uncharacterized protein n=1 Tax=Streptomyces echinatus TaxID=67293 RepID=A0A7W9Q231_9ACTN|nr:hypothetical protein [Streptomyces echinatus]